MNDVVELRKVVIITPSHSSHSETEVLQYRARKIEIGALGVIVHEWGDWKDIPSLIVES